ncbi:MAG TPA: hypothetical protein VFM09_14975 [Marmoricola sp.]|nr:hypothetical protein [Marmoricola sp.]
MQKFEQSRRMKPQPDEDVEAHMGTPLAAGDGTTPQAAMTPVLPDEEEDVTLHLKA